MKTPREIVAVLKGVADQARKDDSDLCRRRLYCLLKELLGEDAMPIEVPPASYMLAIADDLVDSFREAVHKRDERN